MEDFENNKKKVLIMLGVGVAVFVLLIVIMVFTLFNKEKKDNSAEASETKEVATTGKNINNNQESESKEQSEVKDQTENANPNEDDFETTKKDEEENSPDVLFTVGKEKIYKDDLEYYLSRYPFPDTEGVEEMIKDKIKEDSIILQGAEEDGFIKLDKDIFNSRVKDYKKRGETLDEIKKKVASSSESITGAVVYIWPYNNIKSFERYEADEKIVKRKIEELHKKVKSGQMTIEQAGEAIKKDSSLAKIDNNYQGNAIRTFENSERGAIISSDTIFNKKLWELEEGGVTDITYSMSIDPDGKPVITSYYFGAINKKVGSGKFNSFSDWYKDKKSKIGS